ncbi:MAG: hypothetical protein IJ057_10315 [Bacteroidales bacterium]|nr:hypothetical protein [Bacteroidales bacterium]
MKTKKQLIRDFHILLHRLGISDIGKEGILAGYGVDSSTELDVPELTEICQRLKRELPSPDPSQKEGSSPAEKEQRRLRVAIGKLLAAQGKIKADGWGIVEWNLIAGTACRAAKVSRMADIPASKCRGLIYEFNKQREGIERAKEYTINNQ